MFGFLQKDPKKSLELKYQKIMEKAVEAQRNGDIELYSKLTFESEEILKQIDHLTSKK